jgi:hypothetical protein
MGVYSVAVVGESFRNSDGSDRQAILPRCRAGDRVTLEHDPDNSHDPNAVKVVTGHGCIGMIGRGDFWIFERLDASRYLAACIQTVGQEPESGLWGAVLRVSTDAEIDPENALHGRNAFDPFGDDY